MQYTLQPNTQYRPRHYILKTYGQTFMDHENTQNLDRYGWMSDFYISYLVGSAQQDKSKHTTQNIPDSIARCAL
jgi:hypothetical protein